MPRIRSIKPDYWTSEQVISCSPVARLLFIGLWNFADDNGVHPASYISLKAQVYPGDNFTVEDIRLLVNELIDNELLCEYVVDGKNYWIITGWRRHQKIDKPHPGKYPLPVCDLKTISNKSENLPRLVDDDSTNNRRDLDESSSLIRKDRMRENGIGEDNKSSLREDVVSETNNTINPGNTVKLVCPHDDIKSLYHEILPICPQVRIWNKTRRGYLKQRWREDPKHQSLDWWRRYFEYVKQSKFLTGQISGKDGNPPFLADLEWLIRPNNFVKVIEGKYHGGQS